MSGDSNTPLVKKLGLQDGTRIYIAHAPVDYSGALQGWHGSLVHDLTDKLDWLQGFYLSQEVLVEEIAGLKDHLSSTGQLWISWPKKSSGLATDLDDNIVRQIGLDAGLVDVKVVAIDDTWSALKFVYRSRDRHTV